MSVDTVVKTKAEIQEVFQLLRYGLDYYYFESSEGRAIVKKVLGILGWENDISLTEQLTEEYPQLRGK